MTLPAIFRIARLLRRLRRDRSGASAVEFALVGSIMVVMSIGIIEFGRAFFLRNDVAFAADIAVRKTLLTASGKTCAQITGSTTIKAAITAAARDRFDGVESQLNVAYACGGSGAYLTMTLTYPLTLMIPFLAQNSITLLVARRVQTPVV